VRFELRAGFVAKLDQEFSESALSDIASKSALICG
jgi:hypothetical protein